MVRIRIIWARFLSPITHRACLTATTRVADTYQPSLGSWRQPQVVQLDLFVGLDVVRDD